MKKFMSLVVALVATVAVSSSVFAAIETKTVTAVASFVNSGQADFSFTLKNVSGDATSTTLNWTSSDAFNTGETLTWVRADQYAEVYAKITKAGYNVYMYQTNTESTVYKAEEPRENKTTVEGQEVSTFVYSGLVNKALKGGDYRGYIPVLYSFVPTKNASITFNGTVSTTGQRADRYFTDTADKKADKTTSNFDADYAKIAGLVGPVFGQGDQGDWSGEGITNNTAYMYFFGGFKQIIGGDEYGTDQLQIKTAIE